MSAAGYILIVIAIGWLAESPLIAFGFLILAWIHSLVSAGGGK